MSSGTKTLEIESPVAAPRLFKAAVVDWHNLAPKVASEIILSAALVSGNGGSGSVREFKFSSAVPFSHTKESLDLVDFDALEVKLTLLEGAGIGEKIESSSTHIKFVSKSDGGSVAKVTVTYKLLASVNEAEAEEKLAEAKESILLLFKSAEAYLLANPDAYN